MKTTAALTAIGLLLATGAAFAQTTFATVDANNDGMIEMSELETMYNHDSTMLYFEKYDMDHDGMVTPDEIKETMMMNDSMEHMDGADG